MKAPRFVRIEVEGGLQHHYLRSGKWDHPAGRIESGETPIQAAHRELFERTGYAAEDLKPAGIDGDFHVFRASKVKKMGSPQTEIRWKGLSTLLDDLIEFSHRRPTYERNHIPAVRVPVGGSSCASCRFLGDDRQTCGNEHFIHWHGSNRLPFPCDEYCSDWWTHDGRF